MNSAPANGYLVSEQRGGSLGMEHEAGLPSVLIVCTYFPPQNATAARRPYHLANRLKQRGHKVSVLTSAVEAGTRWNIDIAGIPVHRIPLTRTLPDGNLAQRLIVRAFWATQGNFLNVIFRTLGFLFVPIDMQDRLAFNEADVEQHLGRHDVIVSSGPRWSVVEFGHRLTARWGSTYLVDYRDPWNLELPQVGLRSITWYGDGPIGWLKHRRMRRLERRYTRLTQAITSVSPPCLTNAILCTGVKRAGLVYNGSNPSPVVPVKDRNTHFTLLYSGRLYEEQEWDVVLGAMDRLRERHPQEAARIRLILLGPVANSPALLAMLQAYGDRTGMIDVRPGVDRVEALSLQSTVDVLLNVSFRNLSGIVPVKLLEYLHAGRPILQVSTGQDVQEAIIARTRTGVVIGDPDRLATYLLEQSARWAAGEPLAYHPDHEAIQEFRHERQMDKWVDLLREVHAEHAQRLRA